jgi:hypothetical protein
LASCYANRSGGQPRGDSIFNPLATDRPLTDAPEDFRGVAHVGGTGTCVPEMRLFL